MFSLAVAIGLTPEMLPMLVTINLSKGAIAMSKKDVIVKRLNSIQNFGAMDVLCTDKTGTLTLDKIVLEKYCDVVRKEDQGVLKLAYINSFYQTGLKNILDKAVLKYEKLVVKQYKKLMRCLLIFPEGSCRWSWIWRESIRSLLKGPLKKY